MDGKKFQTTFKTNADTAAKIRQEKALLVWPNNYHICQTSTDLGRIAREISKHREFAFDCETSSLNPWRGTLYCVTIWVGDNGYLINFAHPFIPKFTKEQFAAQLASYFADDTVKKIGFNLKFDSHFIEEQLGITMGYLHADSYTASWLVADSLPDGVKRKLKPLCDFFLGMAGETYEQKFGNLAWIAMEPTIAAHYAIGDAEKHYKLMDYFEQRLLKLPEVHRLFHQVEMPTMNVYFQTERRGLDVDEQYLRKELSPQLENQLQELLSEMHKLGLPENVSVDSPDQLAAFLFDELKLPRIKGNSTAEPVLKELTRKHPLIPRIIEYRKAYKLKTAFVDSLETLLIDGKIRPVFNTIGSETGRSSCEKPNLMNMPIKAGPIIRQAFIAPPGYIFVSKDMKGQELRITAHYSHGKRLQEVALNGDIYSETAAAFYGGTAADYTKHGPKEAQRSKGKIAVLALLYGAGAWNMAQVFECSEKRGQKFLDDFFARFPELKAYQERCVGFAKAYGYINTFMGRRRTIDYKSVEYGWQTKELDRLAMNSPIQGTAADQIKTAFVNCDRYFKENGMLSRVLFPIHDELVFLFKEEEYTKEVDAKIDEIMTTAITMEVPFETSTEVYGKRWGLADDTE